MAYIFSWYTIVAYSLFIVITSLLPLKAPSVLLFPYSDKVFHILAYLGLSFIVANTFKRRNQRPGKLYGFSYAFSLSLVIEICQHFVPLREFEFTDLGANFLGSLIGCLLSIV